MRRVLNCGMLPPSHRPAIVVVCAAGGRLSWLACGPILVLLVFGCARRPVEGPPAVLQAGWPRCAALRCAAQACVTLVKQLVAPEGPESAGQSSSDAAAAAAAALPAKMSAASPAFTNRPLTRGRLSALTLRAW